MLEGERSYQRGQENLVPSNNASSIPENQVSPKAQERPWYIQHFIKLLIGFGLGGGTAALILPWVLWSRYGMSSGSSDQLRLHLLYVTGGIIAVLTLLQTNWKNQGDRLKIDADIKKNEQDAEKNERDHIRQVHTERRSRYTKAVEQLANEKATVRLGGIYTLVGLVDEWLADDTLDPEEQQKEGQVIINNLCSYIRSPFTLALNAEMFEGDSEPGNYEGDFSKDQAAFHEEQDVRRTIFVEMSKRSSTFTRDGIGKIIDTSLGTWSDFEFDFSRAPIFYPLSSLTIEKGNFSSAKFYSNADFSWATFTQNAHFSEATFTQNADFSGAVFTQNADFIEAAFTNDANFIEGVFTNDAYFHGATFTQNANFIRAAFTQNANFIGAAFTQNADFIGAAFTQNADFIGAAFTQNANFTGVTFTSNVYFLGATFISNTYFRGARFFSNADFTGVTFISNAYFHGATFTQPEPIFTIVETDSEEEQKARFSATANPQDYDFSVAAEGKPISCGTASLLGKSFTIPLGTVLFDPTSWDEQKEVYTRVSAPAK